MKQYLSQIATLLSGILIPILIIVFVVELIHHFEGKSLNWYGIILSGDAHLIYVMLIAYEIIFMVFTFRFSKRLFLNYREKKKK